MSKFLLLLGPSGVGKSAIIEELCGIDNRFVYISPYTTRKLRVGERDKISITDNMMDDMASRGEFLVINEIYGVRYATPRLPIKQALENCKFPVLDWPISRIKIMAEEYPNQLYTVYVSPPSIEHLAKRLAKDGRDMHGIRLQSAREELEEYWLQKYVGVYDFEIVSEEGQVLKLTQIVYTNYLRSFSHG